MPGSTDSFLRGRDVSPLVLILAISAASVLGCRTRDDSNFAKPGLTAQLQEPAPEPGAVDVGAVHGQAAMLRQAGFPDAAVDANSRRFANLAQATADAGSSHDVVFEYAGLERAEVEAYLAKIKQAFASKDRRELAGMIDYPLSVRKGMSGKPLVIQSSEEFVRHWDDIVTSQVKTVVASAEMGNLGANWQGVKIGPGTVWFGGKCLSDASLCEPQEIRILAINPPRGK